MPEVRECINEREKVNTMVVLYIRDHRSLHILTKKMLATQYFHSALAA